MDKTLKSKYLLRKVSGSKARYTHKPAFSERRGRKKEFGSELPTRDKMKKRGISYLDTSLVKRWLYSQTEKNFDIVYSEFLTRVQPKYKEEYKDCIFRYVVRANDVVITDSGQVLQMASYGRLTTKIYPQYTPFFVCPETNILKRVESNYLSQPNSTNDGST